MKRTSLNLLSLIVLPTISVFVVSSGLPEAIFRLQGKVLKKMSVKPKKILITTETHEIFVIRHNKQPSLSGYCHKCLRITEFLNLDSAVLQSGRRTRELLKMIETGNLHSIETNQGLLLV